ncbi:phospholipase A1 [Drosophila guanche]|uniref:Blast:Phospholipase A1 n=1 Tax=Drosophila guanche TaxID=7266 RepID=A0A3B0JYF0_DROGU|nr:phospholipase A1 [Drosophila guanche]SPP80540.1 blast:Phospholipase A1 [Drosophila guanche]
MIMKLLLALAFCLLAVNAVEVRENGENGWYVPQADGTMEWMDRDVAEAFLEAHAEKEARNMLNPVTFYLYTQSNRGWAQEIKASSSVISSSYFNPNNPTRFTIHGWSSSADEFINYGVRDAWFTHGDMNMIAVDWGRARSVDYASSVLAVPGVGEQVAKLINFMRDNHGLNLGNTMVIGHSLGAHVSGYAGKNVRNGQLHTIIGLDPALPLFSYDSPNKRLNSNDAWYVESIQTNGGQLGFLKPIGKGAFYPNGGKSQPGCGLDITGSCAHSRSVIYYAEAVSRDNFPTMRCGNYESAVSSSCGSSYSSVRMGATTNAYMVSGDYYVPVRSDAPYGMGN